MKSKRIAIIGGGLTGLVAAYRLSQKGHRITIFEKSNDLGGLMGGFEINGTNLEKAYHHIFKTDTYIIKLAKELGLSDKLQWKESSIGLFWKGKMYPFTTALQMLAFPPLSFLEKIKMGLAGIYLQKTKKWKKFEKITAVEWAIKNFGDKAYEVVWEPLLKGKFHQFHDKVSMAWLWARIHTRGNSKDRDGKERLGYFDGGFDVITQELMARIKKNKGVIKTGISIENIKNSSDKKVLLKIGGRSQRFDKAIAAVPNNALVKMIGEHNFPKYSKRLNGINYLGAVVLVFTSKQSLSQYYWHNINDLNSPFLAFLQHTNLVDKKNYGNQEVYYMGTYLPNDHKLFGMSEKEIEDQFFGYLPKVFGQFKREEVSQVYVFKLPNAQHVVEGDYALKIPNYKTPIRHLFLANFSQIYPEDRGTNFAVREGEKVAGMI